MHRAIYKIYLTRTFDLYRICKYFIYPSRGDSITIRESTYLSNAIDLSLRSCEQLSTCTRWRIVSAKTKTVALTVGKVKFETCRNIVVARVHLTNGWVLTFYVNRSADSVIAGNNSRKQKWQRKSTRDDNISLPFLYKGGGSGTTGLPAKNF